MNIENSQPPETQRELLARLTQLRHFAGQPADFWLGFLRATAGLTNARQAVLAVKNARQPDAWQKMAQWPSQAVSDRHAVAFQKQFRDIAEQCAREGGVMQKLDGQLAPDAKGARRLTGRMAERGEGDTASEPYVLAIRLHLPKTDETGLAVYLMVDGTETQAREGILRLEMVADTALSFYLNLQAQQARADVEKLAGALDLITQVNAEKRFMAAALTFCNALAARHRFDRVSLGWNEQGLVCLQAISRTEKFDRQMAAVKSLEAAMEEALDQDEEVVWPRPEGASTISRDHEALAREQGIPFLCSLPLRLDGKTMAVATCERHREVFTELELKQLRLSCDLAIRRLEDLKRADRWFGARLGRHVRELLGRFLGCEHTWAKAAGVTVGVAIIAFLVARMDYRIEGKFILHSDEVAYVSAPFDSFIEGVEVRVGDPIKKQQALLGLDRRELELEESAALADLGRYTREAEKARATKALADMRIAEALASQAQARLGLVRYRLDQSRLVSPFDGVVIEGEQKERLGAPVKQGEVLFKVARTDTLYVELEIDERDIHEIKAGAVGEIAFASQPKLKFPIHLVRIQPAAQPKEGENVFQARCAFTGPLAAWWRPGMTGIGKIEVGRRSLLWVVTHRTVDYLRLLLWW